MLTPKNITELKKEVRKFVALANDKQRNDLRARAFVTGNNPDLFGWLRLWCVTKEMSGVVVAKEFMAALSALRAE